MIKSSLFWRHVSGFTQINKTSRQAAQGAHWGGLKADPPRFLCRDYSGGYLIYREGPTPTTSPPIFTLHFK